MNRKKLSFDDIKVESMVTGSAELVAGTTTLTDPGDTAPPMCNSVQTCVC